MNQNNADHKYLTSKEEEEEEASPSRKDDCSSSSSRCVRILGYAFVMAMIFQVFLQKYKTNPQHRTHPSRTPFVTDDPTTTAATTTTTTTTTTTKTEGKTYSIRLLHMGNSIQYYNDAPHVLHAMLRDSPQLLQHFENIEHRVCLRGGANLRTLFDYGTTWYRRSIGVDFGVSKVQDLFTNKQKVKVVDYQFAIFNDYTQSPARKSTRQQSLDALQKDYLPLLMLSSSRTTSTKKHHHHSIPIFIQTAAYRKDYDYGTKDIGNFDQFTSALWEGYSVYKRELSNWMSSWPSNKSHEVYIAPMGMAYKEMKQRNVTAWSNLYVSDNKHPSEQGTLLQAYLLYMTIIHHITNAPTTTTPNPHSQDPPPPPPVAIKNNKRVIVPPYNPKWFPKYDSPTPIIDGPIIPPTQQEAKEILQVAYKVFDQYCLQQQSKPQQQQKQNQQH